MKKYNAKDSKARSDTKIETAEVAPVLGLEDQIEYGAYIGLDVHKDTLPLRSRNLVEENHSYEGEITNNPGKVCKLIERSNKRYGSQVLLWCYEAGPCGLYFIISLWNLAKNVRE
uniref:Transposase n=1 Tax=Candidatus Kentrum sp. TC TaxID=2126339 RepID=A0A450ZH25_9GAMM|nr:MAG: hypothetical protein BECKTC1821D_GA0114238_12352 [Candidatus Kentron sp. TC]